MSDYNVIVVGGGIGGLSTGAFLSKEGKKVLILEKHSVPGGYVTSFTRKNCRFDASIFHLFEMGDDQTINQFLNYLGEHVNSEKLHYKFVYYIGDKKYSFNGLDAEKELKEFFPMSAPDITTFFDISRKMYEQSRASGPPKAPYEMKLFEKLKFGFGSIIKRPTLTKFMLKNGVKILKSIVSDSDVQSILWGYYPIQSLIFWAHAYGWVEMVEDRNYYPEGGMQSIPNALVRAIEKHGGEIKFNSEVQEIIIESNKVKGVLCSDGTLFSADIIVSNAPIHHTLDKLTKGVRGLDTIRKKIEKQNIFISAFFIFLSIDQSYDFENINNYVILDQETMDIPENNLTPENSPIIVIVPPKPEKQIDYSVVVATLLPYDYKDNWQTSENKERGEGYKKLKHEVKNILLERVYQKLGSEFKDAVKFSIGATPLTFERYTYNKEGSIMGWLVDKNYYNSILPHNTAVEDLFLVGHWNFPGFGVPGVLVSGYYLAKMILQEEGIDLEQKFKDHESMKKTNLT